MARIGGQKGSEKMSIVIDGLERKMLHSTILGYPLLKYESASLSFKIIWSYIHTTFGSIRQQKGTMQTVSFLFGDDKIFLKQGEG